MHPTSFSLSVQQAVSIAEQIMNDSGQWIGATDGSPASEYVEFRRIDRLIEIRDSQNPDGPKLLYTPREFAAWLDGGTNEESDAEVNDP